MNRIGKISVVASVVLACLSFAASLHAQPANMTFFISSAGPGKGGDLGGIEGADRHCQSLAQAAGFENIFDGTVAGLHEDLGTMTCRIAGGVQLEVPLGQVRVGDAVRIGIRAGDILLAAAKPHGLSARNLLPAAIVSLVRRDVTVITRVRCGDAATGLEMEVHLTPGAQQSLDLIPGREVWLVIKTYSCHLLR